MTFAISNPAMTLIAKNLFNCSGLIIETGSALKTPAGMNKSVNFSVLADKIINCSLVHVIIYQIKRKVFMIKRRKIAESLFKPFLISFSYKEQISTRSGHIPLLVLLPIPEEAPVMTMFLPCNEKDFFHFYLFSLIGKVLLSDQFLKTFHRCNGCQLLCSKPSSKNFIHESK